jgi:hypothetical protein
VRLRKPQPFLDLVERQLRLFAEEHGRLLANIEAALRSYEVESGADAEERYGDYVDLLDLAREQLEELRDGYEATLDEAGGDEYHEVFNRLARKRFARFAMELD